MEWISVKDRLPTNGTRCLVYEIKGKHTHNCAAYSYPYPCCEPNIAYYCEFNGWKWSSLENSIPNPTHWMTLPKAPNELD